MQLACKWASIDIGLVSGCTNKVLLGHLASLHLLIFMTSWQQEQASPPMVQ